MKGVPNEVKQDVRKRLWASADALDWAFLTAKEKTNYYAAWTESAMFGEILARYIPKGRVRVYLKDTILKDYTRQRLADASIPLRALRLDPSSRTAESFVKPHGRRLLDGRIACWGRAEDWKSILTALFERSYMHPGSRPFGAVLMNASGRWDDKTIRAMVEEVAQRLSISQVVWLNSLSRLD